MRHGGRIWIVGFVVASLAAASCSTAESEPSSTTAPPPTVGPSETQPPTTTSSTTTSTLDPRLFVRYPVTNGSLAIPDTPVGNQLRWLLGAIAAQDDVSDEELSEHFDPAFLTQVPPTSLRAFFTNVSQAAGTPSYDERVLVDAVTMTDFVLNGIVGAPGVSDVLQTVSLVVRLEAPHLISSLTINLFNPSEFALSDVDVLEETWAGLAAIPGLYVARVDDHQTCEPLAGVNGDRVMATGSILKVYVLGALAAAVRDGTLSPDDVLTVTDDNKVLVGSVVGYEPAGTEVSVMQAAELMIGASENTMADHLIQLVGREALEQAVVDSGHADPETMMPFLSINELFHFRFTIPEEDQLRYLSLDGEGRRRFIENEVSPLGPVTAFGGYFNDQHVLDIEWFASPSDICRAYLTLRQIEDPLVFELVDRALASGTVVPDLLGRWDRVWFKGGSEARNLDGSLQTAIFNFAWFLEDFDGPDYVVVSKANDPNYGVDTASLLRHNQALTKLIGELEPD